MADDGFAEVYNEDVPVEVEEQAVEAQESCPVSVILIE
jgi:ferredoxin